MREPLDIAIAALQKMRDGVEPDHEFPGDAIWAYASEDVEPLRKPPVFKTLSAEGYIVDTGEKTNAVTPDRRSAPTTKYRFGPKLRPDEPLATLRLTDIARDFAADARTCLQVRDDICRRLLASLLAKRFVLVTGLSGSGKTRLSQAVARWLTPTPSPGSRRSPWYSLVPVGADWTGNEHILGYPDALDDAVYVAKAALEVMIHADQHPGQPHFLILDEMNLSHVERYFADLLSGMESSEPLPLYRGTVRRANDQIVPHEMVLPKNLYVIGTVNIDETTYMFSPKVLDRANVIEFRVDSAEMAEYLHRERDAELAALAGRGVRFGRTFVETSAQTVALPPDVRRWFEREMLAFFEALAPHGAEFGYRVAREAARFIYHYGQMVASASGPKWQDEAFDCVVVQKLLPKVHGSRARLGPVLRALWSLCLTAPDLRQQSGGEPRGAGHGPEHEPDEVTAASAHYPISASKIARMWRLMMDHGFASFAEA